MMGIQDSHGYTSRATYSRLYRAPTYTQDTNRYTIRSVRTYYPLLRPQ
ncbi:MAG: hypothetical protein ACOCWZ_12145 [Spirochaetota bacterium]